MTAQPIRRAVAVVAAATLTATLATTALATEVEAAKPKPKCQGKVATIVGTKQADVLKGTAKRDVIVAKGGNDRIYAKGGNDLVCAGPGDDVVFGGRGADTIWGQFGQDTLNGNVGPDFLAGQVGDDTINGGIGVDTCYQGTGVGPVTRCERPAPPPPAPPPAAPAPAPAPTPAPPEPKTLVLAYSDLDGNPGFGPGDVLISKIVDTDGNGKVSPDDTIKMGSYPVTANPTSPVQFLPWGEKSHVIDKIEGIAWDVLVVRTSSGGMHQWIRDFQSQYYDGYAEYRTVGTTGHVSQILDYYATNPDAAIYDALSPSQPSGSFSALGPGSGDDPVIEVEFLWGGSIL